MHILYKIVLVIHIAAAAVTIGASTGLLRLLRRALEVGQASFALAAEDAVRRGKAMGGSGFMTLLTGLTLIFLVGGFRAVPLNIHIALGLMLVALAISVALMRPNTTKIAQLAKSEVLDREALLGHIKKLAMGQGMLHLIWITILVLMLVRIEK